MAHRSAHRPLCVFTLRATRRQGKVNLHYKRPKYNVVAITSAELTNLFAQSHLNTRWNCNLWSKESINDKHSWRLQVPHWMDPEVCIMWNTYRASLTKSLNESSLSWRYKWSAIGKICKLQKIWSEVKLRKFHFIADFQYHDFALRNSTILIRELHKVYNVFIWKQT